MTENSSRLSDEEVRAILKRATEVELTQQSRGLTIEELRDVAGEVGIPPEALSKAIREVSLSTTSGGSSVQRWGRHQETQFVSVTASDEDVAWLLRLLDRLGQIDGEVSYEDGLLRWRSSQGHEVELLCRPSEAVLRIEADDRAHLIKVGTAFVAGGAAWTVALAPLVVGTVPEIFMPLVTGATIGAASWIGYWKVRTANIREQVSKLARGLSDTVKMTSDRESSL